MHGGRTSALVATEGGQQQDDDHDIEHGHGHQAALEIQPKEAALACDPRRKEGHHGDLQDVASNGHEVLAAQEEEQELMHDGVGPPLGVCKHTGAGAAAASASGGQLQAVAGLMREKGEQQQQQKQQHIEQKVAQPLQQVH